MNDREGEGVDYAAKVNGNVFVHRNEFQEVACPLVEGFRGLRVVDIKILKH